MYTKGNDKVWDEALARGDRWEIRGDRVVRVIQIPRIRNLTPNTEPDPCPVSTDNLTDKRVTICKPKDRPASQAKTIIDV